MKRGIGRAEKAIRTLTAAPVRLYQMTISPLLPRACRFEPGCAEYTRQAILRNGPFRGVWLGLWRLLRCHPWGGSGYDPVPWN